MDILSGCPEDVLDSLIGFIDVIACNKSTSCFYIGRTNNLEAIKNRHGCDYIISIYKTNSLEHSLKIEDALIKAFHNHPKNNNDADHSGSSIPRKYPLYVYLAVWYKKEEQTSLI
ncbi:MAG: hypothetical protein PHX21_13515 [bacterium]|nr:hypothetical protein [bacterium]